MSLGDFLRAHDLVPRKRLGQHFLQDDAILRSIVEPGNIDAEQDLVLEVGPGPGTLTRHLVMSGARVIAAEIDPRFRDPVLEHLENPPNLRWVEGDCLARKNELSSELRNILLEEGAGSTKRLVLIANLPYSISVPIIVNLIEEDLGLRGGVVTIQAEVADRIVALPGSKAYGPVSVLMRGATTVHKLRSVKAGSFWPPPKVGSAVISFTVFPDWRQRLHPYAAFRQVVWGLFRYRRKSLGAALRTLVGEGSMGCFVEVLDQLGTKSRPERLDVDDFLSIARSWSDASLKIKGS